MSYDVGTLRAASRIRPLKNIHEEFPRESFHKDVSTQHAASLRGGDVEFTLQALRCFPLFLPSDT